MTKQCHRIPPTLNMEEAASFTAAGVAVYRMLNHWEGNQVKEGDVVLVYGAPEAWEASPSSWQQLRRYPRSRRFQ